MISIGPMEIIILLGVLGILGLMLAGVIALIATMTRKR